MDIKKRLIRLAYGNPQLRSKLLPFLREGSHIMPGLSQPSFRDVAQLVGMWAEAAGDLEDALMSNVPDDPTWSARYWLIWNNAYPSQWPDFKKLLRDLGNWSIKIFKPMIELQDDYDKRFELRQAYGRGMAAVISALEEFQDSFLRLHEMWEEAEPPERDWAREYESIWKRHYPSGWPNMDALARSASWMDTAISGYQDLSRDYARRNRFIQAASRRIALRYRDKG